MTLREAIMDSVDARDAAVKSAGETAAGIAQRAVAGVVVEAAKARSTAESVAASVRSDATLRAIKVALALAARGMDEHAAEHAALIRGAGKGRDEGPVTRAHLAARRAARGG